DKALGNSPTSRIGLGETFKTFDTFENGVATSIKSINLKASSYQSGSVLLTNMKKAINAASEFKTATLNGLTLDSDQIKTKIVNFVINDINLNQSQMETFKKVIRYGQEKGIKIKITIIK
ncbi:hypothetical protein, partial [Leptotrichia sp. OH3620_COT-345]|uniref:endonuclease toxin domain-containing protein n=1 Tax=Leptotrichia sp. OH3620_COT-345 TaxID=2491048 RepID=UPI0013152ADE